MLSVLPLYTFSSYNDLMLRGSIPLRFVFWIVVLRVLAAEFREGFRWQASALLAFLMVGALQPAHLLGGQIELSHRGFNFVEDRMRWSIADLLPSTQPIYEGRPDSFFFRRLAP